MISFFEKAKIKVRDIIVRSTRQTSFYYYLYKSYWHLLLVKQKDKNICENYFAARPNPDAGIGHKLANWIAGYSFAIFFSLKFAHITFNDDKWENFLGFGDNEISVDDLINNRKYKKVILPLFDENNISEVKKIKEIIQSYSTQQTVFITEQDQFYYNQYTVMENLKRKFYSTEARKNDKIIYSKDDFNIALHIRRGDIVLTNKTKHNGNLAMRWLDNDYYVAVLENVFRQLIFKKTVKIFLFSEGTETDFPELSRFDNIRFCFDLNARESFLHMAYADMLITSRSSFSYKPALLNNGIKICPKDFWHGYPVDKNWILADSDGKFSTTINIL